MSFPALLDLATKSSLSAIALSIGQTILTNGLAREVPKAAATVSPKAVFNIGATNLAALTTDPKILKALRRSYSQAVVNVLYFALGIVVFALPFALALEWKNVKKVSAQRIQEQKDRGDHSGGDGKGGVPSAIG